MAYKISKKERKTAIQDFQDMKDKAVIKAYSEKSLKTPLTDYELKQYKEAFFRYYKVSKLYQQKWHTK